MNSSVRPAQLVMLIVGLSLTAKSENLHQQEHANRADKEGLCDLIKMTSARTPKTPTLS
jgi:hypothetical protein